MFEALLKTVLRYFRESIGTPVKKSASAPESMQLTSVKASMLHFSVRVHPDLIARLLDSALRKRGSKSARRLRNGLAHMWDANDATEVLDRFDHLNRDLLAVINAIEMKVSLS